MTEYKTKTLSSGPLLQTFDKDGLLQFMATDRAYAAGVVVALVLSQGQPAMLVFSGQPLNEKISTTLSDTVSSATVLVMPPYFDHRHAEFLCRSLMKAIADHRGITPVDDYTTGQLGIDNVPYGDRESMTGMVTELLASINEVMDRDLVAEQPLHDN